jgi:oxaloacetate decarboxylase gamma subunit
MTIAEMLQQSGVLTLLGLGVVVLFLTILIVCVALMGTVVRAVESSRRPLQPQAVPAAEIPVLAAVPASVVEQNDPRIVAIAAAVYEYRKATQGAQC